MALADDLLHPSRHLAGLDLRRPRQASLRRAVSTACYALFHLLIADAVNRMSLRSPSGLSRQIARAFLHSEMKQVCRSISSASPAFGLAALQPEGFSNDLKKIARRFVNLQEARHRADYDLSATYTRTGCLDLIQIADDAFRTGCRIRQRQEAEIFLFALLFAGRWAK